ncbi:hypothetical protein Tco_1449136 [Tanacetum coccineum]
MEVDEDDDPDDIAKIFKIKDNLFEFDTPLCKAFNEFNYLLIIDTDLLTFDIQEIKNYEEYELNNNMTEDLKEPWIQITERLSISNCRDHKWYNKFTDGKLKEEALMHKARFNESWGDATPENSTCLGLRKKYRLNLKNDMPPRDKKHFKTQSLDESRSPDFDQFSDQESSQEEVAETMEQYMSKNRADYGSRIARPKIEDNDSFELKGQFLKKLRDNTFSGSDHEDANEHIEKVLEIVDLFHIPNITQDQVKPFTKHGIDLKNS